jgi:hypothetical protein
LLIGQAVFNVFSLKLCQIGFEQPAIPADIVSMGAQVSIEALDSGGETIHVRGDGPKVRAVDVQKVRGEFERLYATGEADPKKRADASRKAFKRTLAELPPQFATESQEGRELIWKVD